MKVIYGYSYPEYACEAFGADPEDIPERYRTDEGCTCPFELLKVIINKRKRNKTLAYKYGAKLTPVSFGNQPNDLCAFRKDYSRNYRDFIYYKRMLSDEEIKQYGLDYLGTEYLDF